MSGTASDAPRVPHAHREGELDGCRGCRLYWQAWLPESAPKAVVTLSHGVSEHSGRYRHLVERLIPEGFAIYAVDHRGHGRSSGPRSFIERMAHVRSDFDQLVDLARREHPDSRLFLLGHSFGGCVALSYALHHQDKLDALALSAPVAIVEAAPPALRAIARTLSVISPRAPVYEVVAEAISRDPEEVRAYDEDPRVYRGKLPARTVTEIADTVGTFPDRLGGLTLPLLVMHGTADRIVPIGGSRLVEQLAGSEDKTLRVYDGFFHEIFNEPAGERDRPLGDLTAWMSERA